MTIRIVVAALEMHCLVSFLAGRMACM